jgi:hypothetical protein
MKVYLHAPTWFCGAVFRLRGSFSLRHYAYVGLPNVCDHISSRGGLQHFGLYTHTPLLAFTAWCLDTGTTCSLMVIVDRKQGVRFDYLSHRNVVVEVSGLGYRQATMFHYKLTICLFSVVCVILVMTDGVSFVMLRVYRVLECIVQGALRRGGGNFSIQSTQKFFGFSLSPSLFSPVRGVLSEVREFEKSFLMLVPTGLQPINNACCWQVENLKGTETKKWYRDENS